MGGEKTSAKNELFTQSCRCVNKYLDNLLVKNGSCRQVDISFSLEFNRWSRVDAVPFLIVSRLHLNGCVWTVCWEVVLLPRCVTLQCVPAVYAHPIFFRLANAVAEMPMNFANSPTKSVQACSTRCTRQTVFMFIDHRIEKFIYWRHSYQGRWRSIVIAVWDGNCRYCHINCRIGCMMTSLRAETHVQSFWHDRTCFGLQFQFYWVRWRWVVHEESLRSEAKFVWSGVWMSLRPYAWHSIDLALLTLSTKRNRETTAEPSAIRVAYRFCRQLSLSIAGSNGVWLVTLPAAAVRKARAQRHNKLVRALSFQFYSDNTQTHARRRPACSFYGVETSCWLSAHTRISCERVVWVWTGKSLLPALRVVVLCGSFLRLEPEEAKF